MIKFQKTKSYCTIPKSFLEDERLSFREKGFLAWIFGATKNSNCEFDDILENSNVSKDELKDILSVLSTTGYLEIKGNNDYRINYQSKSKANDENIQVEDIKTAEEITNIENKKKHLNLYEKCELAVYEFTENEELRNILIKYLEIRLNPAPDSRLANIKLGHVNIWNALLKSLNGMQGDKVKIVEQSITNSWAKFVDLDSNTPEAAPISTSRYTEEEIAKIKERAKLKNDSGRRGAF